MVQQTAFLFRYVECKYSIQYVSLMFPFSAILRDEVKYVHSDADLLVMEKSVRGKKDIVLAYVSSLGTQEHRSVMETAYVYGSKHQFILITGGPVLKHLGVHRSSSLSRVWFLHCVAPNTERCPLTPMRTPLSTLSLHAFLQLMEAPLLSEVYKDPAAVPSPLFPYRQTPQVFLFSHSETERLDRDTAEALAWRLRGTIGMDSIFVLSRKIRFHFCSPGELEDEIVASVYVNRGHMVHMDSITQLTSDDFPDAVAQSGLTVVLFYLKWDAVSMAFLSSFTEVAQRLADAGVVDVHLSAVDCGEWTDLCAARPVGSRPISFQPITAFPSVLLLRPHEPIQVYRGMLGCEPLLHGLKFHRLCRPPKKEILGKNMGHPYVSVFNEAAKSLQGRVLIFFPLLFYCQPELTVENLPSFLSLGKALLLLFVGEEEDELGLRQNTLLLEEMKRLLESGGERMEPYLTCWIHLGRTPAGMSVLGSYLGSLPPLPALILTHLPSGREVYEYPPNTPITAQSVLQWLQRVEDAKESPAGILGNDDWPPSVELYDFLKIMDEEEPGFAKQRVPQEDDDEEEEVDEAESTTEQATADSSYRTPHHSEL
uniref:Thioredoxin domain containing 16 n=1 Tax=Hippocampus comes TaxID=109280 RepID=A0A3Q2XAM6_HIPCM